MVPALTSAAISVRNVKNWDVLTYASIWLHSKQQNSIWSRKYRMSGVTTPLLKFSKFSAQGKHLSSNFYQKTAEAIKFLRSIFPLVLFWSLLTCLSSCFYEVFQPYLSTKSWEEIGCTGISPFSLSSSCFSLFPASSLLMQDWNRLNDGGVKIGIVGLNKTSTLV